MAPYNNRSVDFGLWIRARRLTLGFTQQQVAQNVDRLSQCEVSRIERRGYIPNEAILASLYHFLQLDPGEGQQLIENRCNITVLQQRSRASQQMFMNHVRLSASDADGANVCVLRDTSLPLSDFRLAAYERLLTEMVTVAANAGQPSETLDDLHIDLDRNSEVARATINHIGFCDATTLDPNRWQKIAV